ncbi:hypothetical protein HR45_03425 [Shewanella mangrovi]|uniref:Fanconi-associated nuclease 1-like winged-helix domain-containing protein n=1 Tax=Shewanella mangrovi TaxID=1515746 RepID=A0A094JH03_9GAMM|nr:hypothetical protein [Shewanella mangrovi]KFZ38492.1 hypothetical protein HR45_03425 [Shewanella mangrovi]
MPISSNVELPVDYYLHNFERLFEAAERYLDILPTAEANALRQYQQLSKSARMLLVRLLSRKGNYFRRQKLCYAEIDAFDGAVTELLASDLVADELPDPQQFFKLVTLAELRPLADAYLANVATLNKAALLELLLRRNDVVALVPRMNAVIAEQWLSLKC